MVVCDRGRCHRLLVRVLPPVVTYVQHQQILRRAQELVWHRCDASRAHRVEACGNGGAFGLSIIIVLPRDLISDGTQ